MKKKKINRKSYKRFCAEVELMLAAEKMEGVTNTRCAGNPKVRITHSAVELA